MRQVGISVAIPLALFLSSCEVREILPNDLSDPAHARYVASGDKDKDRQEWWASIVVCQSLLQSVMEDLYTDCLNRPGNTAADCGQFELGGYTHTTLSFQCANGITDFEAGARGKQEFWDEMKDF